MTDKANNPVDKWLGEAAYKKGLRNGLLMAAEILESRKPTRSVLKKLAADIKALPEAQP